MRKYLLGIMLLNSVLSFSQKKWSLQNCIDYAIEHNLQISAEKINLENQKENIRIAKKEKLPIVSGSINNSLNFGQNVILGTLQRNDNLSNNASLSASIQIYGNGKLKKSIEKAQYDVETADFNKQNIENNIILQIIQSYLQVLLNKEVYKIDSGSYENADKLYQKSKLTTQAGLTAFSVESEALAEVSRKQQAMLNTENEVKRTLFNLSVLLQLEDEENFDIEDVSVSEIQPQIPESTESYIENALKNQPVIKSAETQIKSAKMQTEIIKSNLYPILNGNLGLGTYYFKYFNDNYTKSPSFFKQYYENFGQQVS